MTPKEFKRERIDSDTAEQILEEALRRWKVSAEAESDIREKMLDDLKFFSGEQWPAHIRAQREKKNRPCITVNRIPQFVQQITNDQRQNRPAIHVNPVEDSDVDVAEVLQGLIRNIEVASDAGTAYDIANEHQVVMGRGWVRVITEYCDDESDLQDIRIEPVRSTFSVYDDPACQKPDGSDAMYRFVVQDMRKDSYRNDWPNSRLAGVNDWNSIGNSAQGWVDADGVRVAEYWRVVTKKRKRITFTDGTKIYADELAGEVVPKDQIVSERFVTQWQVQQHIINGFEILQSDVVPGKWIPLVPATGKEHDVDGEKYLAGAVRDAKDSQRTFNYSWTNLIETVALAPRAPFVIAAGQVEGFEDIWQTANTENHAYLPYVPMSVGGQYVAPPQRNQAEPPIQAHVQAVVMADNNLKATFGIYDASLGNKGNETSGRAIMARQKESDVANFHFADNFNRMVRHVGRIILSWIPYYYDAERIVRITMPDGETREVAINQPTAFKGVEKVLDVRTGRYDIAISTGPSYQTKRQEGSEALLQLAQAAPILMERAPHLIVKNLDIPGAMEIADVLTPPDQREENQQIPPQAQMVIQQLQEQLQAKDEFAQQLFEEKQAKTAELQSKEKIELEKIAVQREELQAKIAIEQMKIGSSEAISELNAQLQAIKVQIDAQQAAYKQQADAEKSEREMEFQREQAERDREVQAEQAKQKESSNGNY
jgi:hypothetical protein